VNAGSGLRCLAFGCTETGRHPLVLAECKKETTANLFALLCLAGQQHATLLVVIVFGAEGTIGSLTWPVQNIYTNLRHDQTKQRKDG
jgi:hypothetical protein